MADPWSDAAILTLRKLHPEGASFGEIAKAIEQAHGVKVSRSAVIGKANRLGLVRGHVPAAPGKSKPQPKPREPVAFRVAPKQNRVYIMPPSRPLKERAEDIGTVTLLDAQHHHCRWPTGEPSADDFSFCGARKMDGSSYCPAHHLRSSSGLPPKRARAA